MNTGTPLSEFMEGKTQTEVARQLGVTQGGLQKMIVSGRDIRICQKSDGSISAFEIRDIPAKKNANKAA